MHTLGCRTVDPVSARTSRIGAWNAIIWPTRRSEGIRSVLYLMAGLYYLDKVNNSTRSLNCYVNTIVPHVPSSCMIHHAMRSPYHMPTKNKEKQRPRYATFQDHDSGCRCWHVTLTSKEQGDKSMLKHVVSDMPKRRSVRTRSPVKSNMVVLK